MISFECSLYDNVDILREPLLTVCVCAKIIHGVKDLKYYIVMGNVNFEVNYMYEVSSGSVYIVTLCQ